MHITAKASETIPFSHLPGSAGTPAGPETSPAPCAAPHSPRPDLAGHNVLADDAPLLRRLVPAASHAVAWRQVRHLHSVWEWRTAKNIGLEGRPSGCAKPARQGEEVCRGAAGPNEAFPILGPHELKSSLDPRRWPGQCGAGIHDHYPHPGAAICPAALHLQRIVGSTPRCQALLIAASSIVAVRSRSAKTEHLRW